MDSKQILTSASENYKLAFNDFVKYYFGRLNYQLKETEMPSKFLSLLEHKDTTEVKSFLYDFFEARNIIITAVLNDIRKTEKGLVKRWGFVIWIDEGELRENDFVNREEAEWVAFEQCFMYRESDIKVEYIRLQSIDQNADSSPVKLNYALIRKFLYTKRKNVSALAN